MFTEAMNVYGGMVDQCGTLTDYGWMNKLNNCAWPKRYWIALNWFVCCISWVMGYVAVVIFTFSNHNTQGKVLFHPFIIGFYFGWEILHSTKKFGTSTFSSFWLRTFSVLWAMLDSMTVVKLFIYGYCNSFEIWINGKNYSLILDQIMFCIGFIGIWIAIYIEGPPNKNVKYASIPITAVCMLQLCIDTLTLKTCQSVNNSIIFHAIAWGIGIGNITGAIATWHKIPWGIYGKLSWIVVSLLSMAFILIVTVSCQNSVNGSAST